MFKKKQDEKTPIVEIVLENCECFAFKDDGSVVVYLDGIKVHHYSKTTELLAAKHCMIAIAKDAEVVDCVSFDDKKWWERIDKDITQVIVNGQTYFVDWGDNQYENEYEKDIDDKEFDRMVYIISKTRKKAKDF